MGKTSRKLNKKKQKETIQGLQAAGSQLRDQMRSQERSMQYAKVIETLSELVDKKLVTAEDMYVGAVAYFMLGDYTRAGQCVNSVLTMRPAHIGARILLAKLCLNEERIDDALAIYEFVLSNFGGKLTKDQEEEILESLRYYGRHESEMLKTQYAGCYEFLMQHDCIQEKEDSLAKAAAVIAGLKKEQDIESLALEPVKSAPEPVSDPIGQTIQQTTEQEKMSVMTQSIALVEKVRLLNCFAGVHYYKNDYSGAKELLTIALEIDPGSDTSLRNMAMAMAGLGEIEKAVAVAGKMRETDFVLLQQLKK